MQRRTLALAIVLLSVAVPARAQAQSYYHYECVDGASFELAVYPDTKAVFLQFDGKSLRLPKSFSLTSQRFSKSGIVLSMKGGGKATIKHYGKTSQCQVN
jgi:membrane-bound inhibitor of C-type lysozyme